MMRLHDNLSWTSGWCGRGFCSGCSSIQIPTFHRLPELRFRALLSGGASEIELALTYWYALVSGSPNGGYKNSRKVRQPL
jgi:hypothetical protein